MHIDIIARIANGTDIEHGIVIDLIEIALNDDPVPSAVPDDIMMNRQASRLVVAANAEPLAGLRATAVYPVVTNNAAGGCRLAGIDKRDILTGNTAVVDMIVFDKILITAVVKSGVTHIEKRIVPRRTALACARLGVTAYVQRNVLQGTVPGNVMDKVILGNVFPADHLKTDRRAETELAVFHFVVIAKHPCKGFVLIGTRIVDQAGIHRIDQVAIRNQAVVAIGKDKRASEEIKPGYLNVIGAVAHLEAVVSLLNLDRVAGRAGPVRSPDIQSIGFIVKEPLTGAVQCLELSHQKVAVILPRCGLSGIAGYPRQVLGIKKGIASGCVL